MISHFQKSIPTFRNSFIEVLVYTVLIAPLVRPNGISSISTVLGAVYKYGMYISFLAALFFYLKRKKIQIYVILIALFLGWIYLVTLFTGGSEFTTRMIFIQCVGLALYTSILSKRPVLLIRCLYYNLEILIYLNFICLLIFPNGMYVTDYNYNWNNWLLGYDNHWFVVFYVAMILSFLYSKYGGTSLRSVLLIMIIHMSTVIVESGVLIIGLLVIDFLVLTKVYKSEFFSYKTVWILIIAVNIVFVLLSTSNIVSFIISFLHKSGSSISARANIWRISIKKIGNNFVFGYGHVPNNLRILEYNNVHGVNAHNFIIEVLYEGGLIGFVLLCLIMVFFGRKISKYADFSDIKLILVGFLTCQVSGAVDSLLEPRCVLFFWLISFGCCYNQMEPYLTEAADFYKVHKKRYVFKKGKRIKNA